MTNIWFGTMQVQDASPAGHRAIAATIRLLDGLKPKRLDRERSRAGVNRRETVMVLAHESEPAADIEIAIAESGWTNIYGPHGHEEVYGVTALTDDWEVEVTDAIRTILQGSYEVRSRGQRASKRQVDYGVQHPRSADQAEG